MDQGSVVLWQASPFTGQTMAGSANAISNTTDPRSIVPAGSLLHPVGRRPIDQGSVLPVRVFGSLSIYFTPQPEVVPDLIS